MKSPEIKLSEHFSYRKLLRFVMPSIMMMVFLSIYCVVDGFFVANYAGKLEFAALNFVLPYLTAVWAIGLMIGAGGSALVAKTIGEGRHVTANRIFSMLVYTTIILGVVLGGLVSMNLPQILSFFGATPELAILCTSYGRIILFAAPLCMLQCAFQNLFVAAEKPKIGMYVIIMAGLINIVLDYIFIVHFGMGLNGAAIATAISQVSGGLFPLIYFARKNTSLLRLGKAKFNPAALAQTFTNGFSEFMTNVASSVVVVAYNYQLMKYIGTTGIVAFGTILYVMYSFYAIYGGYCIGSAPIFSYNYGAKNTDELKNMTGKSLKIIAVLGICMFVLAEVFAAPLAHIFVGADNDALNITVNGLRIFALSFAIGGFNIFGSAFFTALNNGVVSAIIAFFRTLVFEVSCVMLLPLLFGVNGIWFSVVIAEILALIIAAFFFVRMRPRYEY